MSSCRRAEGRRLFFLFSPSTLPVSSFLHFPFVLFFSLATTRWNTLTTLLTHFSSADNLSFFALDYFKQPSLSFSPTPHTHFAFLPTYCNDPPFFFVSFCLSSLADSVPYGLRFLISFCSALMCVLLSVLCSGLIASSYKYIFTHVCRWSR